MSEEVLYSVRTNRAYDSVKLEITPQHAATMATNGKLLYHEYRARILELLVRAPGDFSVIEVSEILDIPYHATIYHCAKMYEAHILVKEKWHQFVYYELAPMEKDRIVNHVEMVSFAASMTPYNFNNSRTIIAESGTMLPLD